MSAPSPRYFRYTLAKTQTSLVGAAIICTLCCLTYFVGIDWIQSKNSAIIPPGSIETSGSFWTAANYSLETTLLLLAIAGGAIGAYRGSLKLNLSQIITATLVLVSFVPPVAIVVHGALLVRLRKERSYFADQEPAAIAGGRWPWMGALACFVAAISAQLFLVKASRQAAAVRSEIAAITSPDAVQALMDEAARDRLYYGRDFEVAVLARAQEAGQRRELAEAQLAAANRSATLAIQSSNFAVLAALGFVVAWATTNIRSKKSTAARTLPATGARAVAWDETARDEVAGEASGREFLILRNGQQCGPYSESVLRSLTTSGALNANDTCWTDGWAEWKPVAAVVSENAPVANR